jgi:hypothetical protein
MLDIFKDNAFGVVALTDAIQKIKFVPGRIGQMGLFQETSVNTLAVAIEQKDGQLGLLSPSPRGGPGQTRDKLKRSLLDLRIPHFEVNDAIYADEVLGVRAWGSETQLETVQGKVAERLAEAVPYFTATEEYARIGAVKGLVTYADSSTLDLFTTFGVSQQTEVDFDLDNASPAAGALRKKCASVVRTIQDALEGLPLQGVHALCSPEFYDDLIAHTEVRDTYLGTAAAADLRSGYAYGTFTFGGITFEEYRGSVGATSFITASKCHIFPVGVPGLFRTYYGPADYIEAVNTPGQRLYAKQFEMLNGKGIHLDSQSNALHICTRPRVLVQGKRT